MWFHYQYFLKNIQIGLNPCERGRRFIFKQLPMFAFIRVCLFDTKTVANFTKPKITKKLCLRPDLGFLDSSEIEWRSNWSPQSLGVFSWETDPHNVLLDVQISKCAQILCLSRVRLSPQIVCLVEGLADLCNRLPLHSFLLLSWRKSLSRNILWAETRNDTL